MPSKQEFKEVLLNSFKADDEIQDILDSLSAGSFSGTVDDIFSALTGASQAPGRATSVFAENAGTSHKVPLRAIWVSASRKCIPNAASGGYI